MRSFKTFAGKILRPGLKVYGIFRTFIFSSLRRLFKPTLLVLAIFSAIVVFCDRRITRMARGNLYNDTSGIPYRKVGLLLGTSRVLADNRLNLYFKYRIEAAVALFRAGKISYIVVSGDNGEIYYNEPREMKRELVKRGIPDSCIFLDYAGFRTYDSVIRLHKIFGQTTFTVISQKFHNERALYIARRKGLDAIGFNARDVSAKTGFKTMLREKFARVKVFLDILMNKKPKFLGEEIKIP